MTTILHTLTLLIVVSLVLSSCTPQSPTANISHVWARSATTEISAAYMTIHNPNNQTLRLVSVTSEAVPIIEIHESRIENDVMQMGPLPDGLTIEAGQTIDFEGEGYHLMLINLPNGLADGSSIPLTLNFELADGSSFAMTVDAPVQLTAPE